MLAPLVCLTLLEGDEKPSQARRRSGLRVFAHAAEGGVFRCCPDLAPGAAGIGCGRCREFAAAGPGSDGCGAGLPPESGAEAWLTAQFVAADAWTMDSLRLSQVHRKEPDLMRKCLMREGKATLRALQRMQAAVPASHPPAAVPAPEGMRLEPVIRHAWKFGRNSHDGNDPRKTRSETEAGFRLSPRYSSGSESLI